MLADLDNVSRRFCVLSRDQRSHLRRLVGSWGVLADLSFADLLLIAPVDSEHSKSQGTWPVAEPAPEYVVLAQARPATAQTLYEDDQIGDLFTRQARAAVAAAFDQGEIVNAVATLDDARPSYVTAIPVRCDGNVIAVLTRESVPRDERIHGRLERSYADVSDRLAQMISSGVFPYKYEDVLTEETPRVGDGALVLDADRRVRYCSPNAVSALHRTGFHGVLEGRRLAELGFDADVVETSYRLRTPVLDELERADSASVLARIVPLIDVTDYVNGALVLVRDVSDIRHRDRLLVSMDATIREIHHRVKNNLQTVSSLLRLQARRVDSQEAKDAIEESVRRIASIAHVHELLANTDTDDVILGEVVRPILEMVQTSLVSPEIPIEFSLIGRGPTLPSSVASSLAVLITELVQNAVEHGFPSGSDGGKITLELITSGSRLTVRVHDDGIGVPDGFDVATSSGLGLTIAQTLVTHELDGSLTINPAGNGRHGTVAQLDLLMDL